MGVSGWFARCRKYRVNFSKECRTRYFRSIWEKKDSPLPAVKFSVEGRVKVVFPMKRNRFILCLRILITDRETGRIEPVHPWTFGMVFKFF